MINYQKITISSTEYYIIDSLQNLRAEDSFIHRNNKLSLFCGNGESRKYMGSYAGTNGKFLSIFFEYDQWGYAKTIGDRRVAYPTIQKKYFFSKDNLQRYLCDAKVEYYKQEQNYYNNISLYYEDLVKEVGSFEQDILFFSIFDVSDLIGNNKRYCRAYIRSDDNIWMIWRKLVLPKISYLSILKLKPVHGKMNI